MTHVIKISGYELDQPRLMQAFAIALSGIRDQVVLVHGGGSLLPRTLSAIGGPSHPAASEIASMAIRGGINPRLVAALTQRQLQAIGLSGMDLELMYTVQGSEEPIVRFEVLKYMLDQAWLPVLAPIALDTTTGQGILLNADTAAQMIASALAADELTFIVNTPGIFSDGKLLTGISARQFDRYIKQGMIDSSYTSVVKAAALAAPHVSTVRITDVQGLQTGKETLVIA